MKNLENLTATEKKELKEGYKIWLSLTPLERYDKVMKHFTTKERKGVRGMRKMIKYIIDNNITKK